MELLMTMAQISRFSRIFLAVGLLSGGIIGAGVFALPYVSHESGLGIGLFYLLLATLAYAVLHLMYAEVILNTNGEHRFVGYVGQYLGRFSKFLSVWIGVIQMVLVLTIYLILSKSFLAILLPTLSGEWQVLFFWALGSAAIFLSLKRIAASETIVTLAMTAIIFLIFMFGIQKIEMLSTFSLINSTKYWLLPLPAILFALSGRVAIPALIASLKSHSKEIQVKYSKISIIIGTILPAIVYTLFIIGVLGISPLPSEDAVSGISGSLPQSMILLVGLLGILSLWSSYLLVGLDIDSILKYDFSFKFSLRFLIVVLVPLLLYLFGLNSFVGLVSFVGGIFLVIEAFLIILIWKRFRQKNVSNPIFKKTSTILVIFLVLVFLAAFVGLLLELWS